VLGAEGRFFLDMLFIFCVPSFMFGEFEEFGV